MGLAAQALAAKPAHKGCLGSDVSGYAQGTTILGGSAWGGFVSGGAKANKGLGSLIQAHQAGTVPDTEILNSCND